MVNASDARWLVNETFGAYARFEGERTRFEQVGINISVLQPGQPMALYHGEEDQEDFLVLSGTAVLVVEGQERPLEQWDFVHCPPWTKHIFVGAGEGPCVILMAGSREGEWSVRYPVSELAERYGAGAKVETADPGEAYVGFQPSRRERPSYWDQLPWA